MTLRLAILILALSTPGTLGTPPEPISLNVRTLDGKTKSLSDFRGQVILLNFWSTTCPPCRTETPWFVEFQRTFKDRGFTIIGVSMDDTPALIRAFVKEFGVNYPMFAGRDVEAAIHEATGGIWGMPTSFLIGRDGKVLKKHLGIAPRAVYERSIEAALQTQ
jgi:peroxiredoxin